MDDRETKLLQSHDPQGLTLWFERHVDALHAYVYYRVVRNEQLASEVVQETFLDAMKRIHRFDPKRGSMEAWLTTLSRNHITRALRGGGLGRWNRRRQTLDRELCRCYQQIALEPLPEEVLARQETRDLVLETLATIPGNYRQVLSLFYDRDLSLRDIAAQEKKSEGAVKVLLHRARIAFKDTFVKLSGQDALEGGSP